MKIVVGMMKEWFRNVFKAAANITGVINVKNNTYLKLRLSECITCSWERIKYVHQIDPSRH